jgi:hypothetical protein
MKRLILTALACLSAASPAMAIPYQQSDSDTYVNGYTRSNGTYVDPYYRSAPDSSTYNNYGYHSPTYESPSYSTPSYSAPQRSSSPSWGESNGILRKSR